MYAVKVIGEPITQGSLKPFVDNAGNARMHDDNPVSLAKWRRLVVEAGRRLFGRAGRLDGAVEVRVTCTVPRPKSVPLRLRLWPIKKGKDVDKLGRAILDALGMARLYSDDSQVCHLDLWKCYPDTHGCPDRLDEPGAVIRVGLLDEAPPELVFSDSYGGRLELSHADGIVSVRIDAGPTMNHAALWLPPAKARALARALDFQHNKQRRQFCYD